MVINLIEKALQYSKEERLRLLSLSGYIKEPLTPKARRDYQYRLIKETLNVGCREAVKLLLNPYHRSIAYGILMQAVSEIFHYGKNDTLINMWNDTLDSMIGTH